MSQPTYVQRMLIRLDYLRTDQITGKYADIATTCAIRAFQIANNLEPDGIAGSKTINALESKIRGLDPRRFPPAPPDPGTEPSGRGQEPGGQPRVSLPQDVLIASGNTPQPIAQNQPAIDAAQNQQVIDPFSDATIIQALEEAIIAASNQQNQGIGGRG
jgi:hypothetical protein